MATQDTYCTIVPCFKVHDGHLEAFKGMCEEFLKVADKTAKCLSYGFGSEGDPAHCPGHGVHVVRSEEEVRNVIKNRGG
jgi:hypothetical protein